MNKKELLQKVIGNSGTEKVMNLRNAMLHYKAKFNKTSGVINFCDGRDFVQYSIPGKNLFFGYYDLSQYNSSMEKLLAHIVKKNANPATDKAELVWIDEKDKSIHSIINTQAWCWQQGARLRWHPTLKDTILYNDYDGTDYVTYSLDLNTGEKSKVSRALYDVDKSFSYGLSLNFDRLQRLRPGYGYSCRKDDTNSQIAPADDGVFIVDLCKRKEKLLFSLAELARDIDNKGVQHYINHLSVSPNGKRFMFFHLWTADASAQWNMRFYVSNIDGTGLTMLEDDVRVSHYCWIDDDTLLATRRVVGKEFRHVIYNLATGEKIINNGNLINMDGHPTTIRNGFITDTYPQKNMLQYVFLSNMSGGFNKEVLRLFAEPLCYGEHRCDLHPRVFNERFITIDTTYKGGVRSIVAFELQEEELNHLNK